MMPPPEFYQWLRVGLYAALAALVLWNTRALRGLARVWSVMLALMFAGLSVSVYLLATGSAHYITFTNGIFTPLVSGLLFVQLLWLIEARIGKPKRRKDDV